MQPVLKIIGKRVRTPENANASPGIHICLILSRVAYSLLLKDICQAQSRIYIQDLTMHQNSPYRLLNKTIMYHNVIWMPTPNLPLKVILLYHNNMVAGHPRIRKTKELIRQDYNRKELVKMVEHYVKACTCCIRNKPSHQKPQGLLKHLQVAKCPWMSVFVGFIVELLASNGYSAIMEVVNCFTKFAIFIL